jgi:dCMP deaminase
MERLSIPEYSVKMALTASERSEDPYLKVGCCILNKKGRVLATGYNGLKSQMVVGDEFWKDRDWRRKFMLHAEPNAFSLVSVHENPYIIGISHSPCSSCATTIVANGIEEVYYAEEYHLEQTFKEIFNFYGVKYRLIEKEAKIL